jgi:RNA polymerase sigma-70 factor (ECF subfamily)
VSTDSEIIKRSIECPAAFGELYDRHAPALSRYAARRAGDSVADDVTSETFLVAFERRDRFDHRSEDAGPWLFGIATNLLRHHQRIEMRILKVTAKAAGGETAISDELGRVTEKVDARRAIGLIAGAVRALSAADRDCLLMYAWAEMSYDDIARAMDIPVGTVRSRLNRARSTLREAAGLIEHHEEKELWMN